MHNDIVEEGKEVVGISPQGEDSHRRFRNTFDLPFPLLSDRRKKVIRAFGVDGPLGMGVRRVTFLIGMDGIIQNRVVSDFMIASHTSFVTKAIKS